MSLAVKRIGTGPLHAVFLHGVFGQGKNFGTVAKKLSDVFTFDLVDLPDHGHSVWTEHISYSTYVSLVVDELCELGAEKEPVTLVGHSLGGRIAMLVALDSPELIDRLAILDMAPGSSMKSELFTFYAEQLLKIDLSSLKTRTDADQQLAETIDQKPIRDFLLQNLHRDPGSATGWKWIANLQLLHDELDNFNNWPSWDDKAYLGPTKWIVGQDSDYVTVDSEPLMRRLFPNSTIDIIPHAGHWIHADQPDLVAGSLRNLAKE